MSWSSLHHQRSHLLLIAAIARLEEDLKQAEVISLVQVFLWEVIDLRHYPQKRSFCLAF
jgi:hypothetical protein